VPVLVENVVPVLKEDAVRVRVENVGGLVKVAVLPVVPPALVEGRWVLPLEPQNTEWTASSQRITDAGQG